MKFVLTATQKKNLLTHYDVIKYLPMSSGLSFVDWVKSYSDFPNILLSMANKPYYVRGSNNDFKK